MFPSHAFVMQALEFLAARFVFVVGLAALALSQGAKRAGCWLKHSVGGCRPGTWRAVHGSFRAYPVSTERHYP
jgi:hypothetical protein